MGSDTVPRVFAASGVAKLLIRVCLLGSAVQLLNYSKNLSQIFRVQNFSKNPCPPTVCSTFRSGTKDGESIPSSALECRFGWN